MLCNLHNRGSDSLREHPGFEYGPDTPPEGPNGPPFWDNYGVFGGETFYGPDSPLRGSMFTDHSNDYSSREGGRVPMPRPREHHPPRRVNPYRGSVILPWDKHTCACTINHIYNLSNMNILVVSVVEY